MSDKQRVHARANGGDVTRPALRAQSKLARKLTKIPFLRGLTLFLQPGMWIVLALLAVNDALTFAGVMGESLDDLWLMAGLIVLLAVFGITRRGSVGAARRYHAAEHMALNTLEACLPLTIENVADAPRTHPRCGTNLAVVVLPLAAPVAVFCPYGMALIPVFCLAYEVFLLLPKVRWLKPLNTAGLWAQRHITTAMPGEKEIEVAVRGLKKMGDVQ